jgi:hypothetical protein
MRPKYYIYPYGPSNSARDLAKALGGVVIRRNGSRYVPRRNDVLINWGSSEVPYNIAKVNNPNAVRIASSKLRSFEVFRRARIPHPDFTQDQAVAQEWGVKGRVVARDIDRGSGGRGITMYERGTPIGRHLFYTKYFRKQREFRFHVYKDRVIRIGEKLHPREGSGEVYDKYIRSHLAGWVFAYNHLASRPAPEGLDQLAVAAVRSLDLDFGGVDIGWNDGIGGFVFEVNTAPGLEGGTIPIWAEAILQG